MPLPKHVTRIVKPSGKAYFYFQKNRGREDQGPRTRLPDDPHSPEFWRAIERLSGEGAGPKKGTFDALVLMFKTQQAYEVLKPSSRKVYDISLRHITDAWGPQQVADLEPKHIYALMDRLSATPAMANMVVTVLRVLMKAAIRADYTKVNPAREIERFAEAEVSAEPWAESVFQYVTKNAPQFLARAVILARATGQRGVDIVKLRPADRRDNGFDMLVQKLDNKRHWCPVTAEALAIIDGWGETKMMPYLNIEGRKIKEDTLRKHWAAFRAKHPEAIPGDVTLHDLRASAVCDRRVRGVPHQQIADQICMSVEMVMHYSKFIDAELNSKAGMATMERPENAPMQTTWETIENRKG